MRSIILAFVMAAALTSTVSTADAATNVAVVNIQKIMREAKAAETVRGQLSQKQKEFQAELDQKEKALQAEDQELAKQRNVLSQEAFQKQYGDFRQKAAAAQKEVREKRAKLDKGFTQALADIQKKVTEIVEAVSKEKGYDIAVSGSQVLYMNEANDITEAVLERLNQQMPALNVNFN